MRSMYFVLSLLLILLNANSCNSGKFDKKNQSEKIANFTPSANLKKVYFASGCFWCVEAIFESVYGVEEVISGYSGGSAEHANYSDVSSGYTQHAETVEVYYNPLSIDYKTLVKVFFGSHDATTLNRQGPDFGKQYRSAIFYTNQEEQKIALEFIERLYLDGGLPQGTITTEVVPLKAFYPAEAYHQNYEKLHPDEGYIQRVSMPRLMKFKLTFADLLKPINLKH